MIRLNALILTASIVLALSASELARGASPGDFSGLQLWLKADEGVYSTFSDDGNFENDVLAVAGGPAAGWRDFSGTNRNVVQTDPTSMPTLQLNSGNYFLRFDGDVDGEGTEDSGDYLERLGAGELPLAPTATDVTMLAVFISPAQSTPRGWFFGEFGSNNRYAHGLGYYEFSNRQLRYDNYDPSGEQLRSDVLAPDTLYIAAVDKAGSELRFTLIDAEETRSVSASDVETNYTGTGTINNFRVGARKVADRVYEPLQTDFAELIIYDRRLDDAELADVTAYLSSKYLHPLVGDLNSDHVVDRKDVVRMLQSYGAYTSAGDLNGDGFIGLADLATLQANFGATSGSPAPSAAAVPEPSGLGLLVCGVLALAGTSIRRRGDKGDR